MKTHEPIPKTFPVRPLRRGQKAQDKATCGHCGLSWDDAVSTSYTPADSARCPFEYFHIYEDVPTRTLGRLLVRKGKTAGIFIPFPGRPLKNGIYEIREVMGEITLAFVGTPAMHDARYQGITLNELLAEAGTAGMTQKERDRLTTDADGFVN